MALDGTATEIPVPGNQSGGAATGIVTGPDGAVWFTGRNGFGPMPPGSGPDTPGGFIGRVSGGSPVPPADTTPPSMTITSPGEGSSYSLRQVVPATYSCADASGPLQCSGPVASGAPVDTTTAGTHTFTVTATDAAGNTGSATVSYTVLAGNVSTEMTDGGTVTTDPGGSAHRPTSPSRPPSPRRRAWRGR